MALLEAMASSLPVIRPRSRGAVTSSSRTRAASSWRLARSASWLSRWMPCSATAPRRRLGAAPRRRIEDQFSARPRRVATRRFSTTTLRSRGGRWHERGRQRGPRTPRHRRRRTDAPHLPHRPLPGADRDVHRPRDPAAHRARRGPEARLDPPAGRRAVAAPARAAAAGHLPHAGVGREAGRRARHRARRPAAHVPRHAGVAAHAAAPKGDAATQDRAPLRDRRLRRLGAARAARGPHPRPLRRSRRHRRPRREPLPRHDLQRHRPRPRDLRGAGPPPRAARARRRLPPRPAPSTTAATWRRSSRPRRPARSCASTTGST